MKFFKENRSFSLSLIITIIVGTFLFFQLKNDFFPDMAIQKRGIEYTSAFVKAAQDVENELLGLQSSIDSVEVFNLPVDKKIHFLLDKLNEDMSIHGFMVLDHDGKFTTILRDQKTFLFASDSASKIDNVTWYRVNQDYKILNSWTMALGMELNMLVNGADAFDISLKLNAPQWSSSKQIFSATNTNIVNHLTWRNKHTGKLITCVAIISEESFLRDNELLYKGAYQSFLVNKENRIIAIHSSAKQDSLQGVSDGFAAATKSWEVAGKKIPGTYSYTYHDDFWWGQALKVPLNGINGVILNMSEKGLYYSTFLEHIFELLLILGLIFITSFLLFKSFKRKHQSLADFTKNQSNDQHASELIKLGETSQLEFKSSFRFDYKLKIVNKDLESVIAKSIAAFSNASGGTLLIGVNDDGEVLGIEKDINTLKRKDLDFFENTLRSFLNKTFSVSFVTQNLTVKFPVVNQKVICRIDVISGNDPVFVEINKKGTKSERFYLRSGNTSQEIVSLREINDYIKDRFSD